MTAAISGVAAVDWNTVLTYTLAALFPACIIGFATWLWRRGMKARAAEQLRQKQARDAALAAQIAQTVRDNFATVTESFATLETNVTQRIDSSDQQTAAQVEQLKAGQAEAARKADLAAGQIQRLELVQFGGNGGGIREQVNTTDKKVDGLAEKVESVAGAVAEIKGAFNQYVADNK